MLSKYENEILKIRMSEIARRYGVDFGDDNEKEITEFLRDKGYPSLADLLEDGGSNKKQKPGEKIRTRAAEIARENSGVIFETAIDQSILEYLNEQDERIRELEKKVSELKTTQHYHHEQVEGGE